MGALEEMVTNFTATTRAIMFNPFESEENKERAFDRLGVRFVEVAKLVDDEINRLTRITGSKED